MRGHLVTHQLVQRKNQQLVQSLAYAKQIHDQTKRELSQDRHELWTIRAEHDDELKEKDEEIEKLNTEIIRL